MENLLKKELFYRTFGGNEGSSGIGAGFLNKSGIREDNLDFVFPNYVLVVIICGEGSYIDVEGREYSLQGGMFFQRLPNIRHSNLIIPESNWQEYYLEVSDPLFSTLVNMHLINPELYTGNIHIDLKLKSQFSALLQQFRDYRESEQLKLFRNFIILLTECHERMRAAHYIEPAGKIVDQACKFMAENVTSRVDIKNFCRKHGWGYEKFRKVFKQQTGISPGQYYIRRRLDAGCSLLNNSSLSIAEIAARLGYKSQYEYSAQFKKHFGMAPKYFRRRLS